MCGVNTCSPLARMTSTSRHPFWWHIDSWMSPNEDAPNTWRPTNCPGPRPSIKSVYCPTSAPLSDGDHLIQAKQKIFAEQCKIKQN